jgi:hypothetical protein
VQESAIQVCNKQTGNKFEMTEIMFNNEKTGYWKTLYEFNKHRCTVPECL